MSENSTRSVRLISITLLSLWLSWQRDVSDEVTCQRGRLMDAPRVVGVAINLHIYAARTRRWRVDNSLSPPPTPLSKWTYLTAPLEYQPVSTPYFIGRRFLSLTLFVGYRICSKLWAFDCKTRTNVIFFKWTHACNPRLRSEITIIKAVFTIDYDSLNVLVYFLSLGNLAANYLLHRGLMWTRFSLSIIVRTAA